VPVEIQDCAFLVYRFKYRGASHPRNLKHPYSGELLLSLSWVRVLFSVPAVPPLASSFKAQLSLPPLPRHGMGARKCLLNEFVKYIGLTPQFTD
jgi:hypothetical protein